MTRVMVQAESRATYVAELATLEAHYPREPGEQDGDYILRVWLRDTVGLFDESSEPSDRPEVFVQDGDAWRLTFVSPARLGLTSRPADR